MSLDKTIRTDYHERQVELHIIESRSEKIDEWHLRLCKLTRLQISRNNVIYQAP
jgi:hypothetical protein